MQIKQIRQIGDWKFKTPVDFIGRFGLSVIQCGCCYSYPFTFHLLPSWLGMDEFYVFERNGSKR